MGLSERLLSVAMMVTPGLSVADVGCDHGYLAIHLIRNNIVPHVIAMDINKGPLERAKTNIIQAGLTDSIELRLSNGLKELDVNEVDSIVMAGMGGPLMVDIMKAGAKICEGAKELILQPQSEIDTVRRYLEEAHYCIVSEDMVYEDGKYYPMMKAVHGEMKLSKEIYYRYGKILIMEEHPVLRQYLRYEKNQLLAIKEGLLQSEQTDKVLDRIKEITDDITIAEAAISESDRLDPVAIDRVIK